MLTKFAVALATCAVSLTALAAGNGSAAQCATISGDWIGPQPPGPDWNYTLNQSGTGGTTITGIASHGTCNWAITGDYNMPGHRGQLDLAATTQNGCAGWQTYMFMALGEPGCQIFRLSNSLSATNIMHRSACLTPTGESQNPPTFQAGLATFTRVLQPSSTNWTGRAVSETLSNSTTCTDPRIPMQGDPGQEGPSTWYIGAMVGTTSNSYPDSVGLLSDYFVNAERQHHHTPCTMTGTQVMWIDCSDGATPASVAPAPYAGPRDLTYTIDTMTVDATSGGSANGGGVQSSGPQLFGIPQFAYDLIVTVL